ncbi:hypothetical protein CYMTET_48235 [Cymbomonas tetramitiformis]|uniref:Uncharacterized protein n=1 Tax=Cymbomonas tetramitiformis TaxID=36881 RepID=A0AAE0BUF3_9CHLO|nr:hypothetical protein CYMTET_48235 [Cymbomonas tetramitiformis]
MATKPESRSAGLGFTIFGSKTSRKSQDISSSIKSRDESISSATPLSDLTNGQISVSKPVTVPQKYSSGSLRTVNMSSSLKVYEDDEQDDVAPASASFSGEACSALQTGQQFELDNVLTPLKFEDEGSLCPKVELLELKDIRQKFEQDETFKVAQDTVSSQDGVTLEGASTSETLAENSFHAVEQTVTSGSADDCATQAEIAGLRSAHAKTKALAENNELVLHKILVCVVRTLTFAEEVKFRGPSKGGEHILPNGYSHVAEVSFSLAQEAQIEISSLKVARARPTTLQKRSSSPAHPACG